ncbi:MAG: hypothetical protein AAGK02_15250, partial [Pseudomonadota bacterium]
MTDPTEETNPALPSSVSGEDKAVDTAGGQDDADENADAAKALREAFDSVVEGAYAIVPADARGAILYEVEQQADPEETASEDGTREPVEVKIVGGAPADDQSGDTGKDAVKKGKRREFAKPSDRRAINIYYGIKPSKKAPPKEQIELQEAIDQVLQTVKKLYIDADGDVLPQFRLYYTRLYRLAQLGLEGHAMPEVARAALERVVDDLIASEGPRVKNAYLKRLGVWAAIFVAVFTGLFLVMAHAGRGEIWDKIGVDTHVAASFMVIWIGTSIGVWLSYGIRKVVFKLRDLTQAEEDMVEPAMRLMFAGLLGSLLAMFLMLEFVDVTVGSVSLSSFSQDVPIAETMALVLGLVMGINEMFLP